MKKSVAIILLVLGVFVATSSADEVTLFGPSQYVRTSGAPDVFTDTFSAYPGTGTLIVKNGDQVGENRIIDAISSAEVFINGELIFGPSDFNQNVYLLEAPINLLENNSITIELASKPDSYISVEVIEDVDPPTVNFSAEPGSIFIGESSTLTWQSSTADSCVIEPGIGPIDINGYISVTPTETTTYNITATGLGGTATSTATVTVLHPPTVEISINPPTILSGESATLSWTSTDADSATIDQGIGAVAVNTSISVSPTETTTYTITVTGPGGTATASTVLTVEQPSGPPTVNLSATPATIEQGDTATLSWNSTNADSAHIDNGIGVVNPDGSVAVSPEHTTTYTITVAGDTGTANAQMTVKVTGNPEPQPEGHFGEQYNDLIPPDATVESYDPAHFSLITGLVQDHTGSPIADVSITIHGHSEYGTVATDGEGRFSIPVEGGGSLKVLYQKEGLIPVHRKVYVPWNDIAIAETIQMIAEDPVATTITFDGNSSTVVTHESSEVIDEFGTRSLTMSFGGDNRAFLVDEEGNDIQELTTITTRATEYTTPESMPAKLPPNSAYTYCAELNVDGAERIRFEKPVIIWVDNFLGFEVGMIVPAGYYDRDKGVWVPSDNGVVVKLLDTNTDGITDALDSDGDDQPNDLNEDGSFNDEVSGLTDVQRYPPDTTFWRVSVSHFSPLDLNWPYSLPADSISPNPKGVPKVSQQGSKEQVCRSYFNSFVDNRSRIFHEDIPIPGTEMNLHYASNRVEGYESVITVPVSGETVPASLKHIIVQVYVAGRYLFQILDPLPDQKVEFIWDGLDYLGRPVGGTVTAHVSVGFVYDVILYYPATGSSSFGQPGVSPTTIEGRQDWILWKTDGSSSNLLIHRGGRGVIAKGWTLSAHHHLSPSDPSTLHKGDGSIVKNNATIIDSIAGTGTFGYNGDNIPAIEAQLAHPAGIAVDASGNIYIGDTSNFRIRKIDSSGNITTVAGNGGASSGITGIPAIEAEIHPFSVSVDDSGNFYIVEKFSNKIKKVDTNGIITLVAGTGYPTYGGDGGPAINAKLYWPERAAVDTFGNIYIADTINNRIRKVDTSGIITTVAGGGNSYYFVDGGLATDAQLANPRDVAVDLSGNLYIADTVNQCIRKVDISGIITTVAGVPDRNGYRGDGGPAKGAWMSFPRSVAVDSSGQLYILDSNNVRVRKVDTDGIITTVAGSGIFGYSGDGDIATAAQFNAIDITVDAAGNLYIADYSNYRVRKIGLPSAFAGAVAVGDIVFAEEEMAYFLSSAGRHKSTIDLDAGVPLHIFDYDEDSKLISITDQFNNQIVIQRDPSGITTAIVSPDGITTNLTIDANNHLTRASYPDGSFYSFEYTSDGLMTVEIEPEQNRFDHVYDSTGRLTDATDEEGGHWNYARTTYENGDILTDVLTGEGNVTSYLDHTESTGAYTSTITDPTGAETLFNQSADGLTSNKTLPCGMELETTEGVDPEYKFKYVKEMRERTPFGLEKVTMRDRTYQDTNSDGIADLITETIAANGNTTTLQNNILQSQKSITSPEGRTVITMYDPDTLLDTSLITTGLYETTYGYDAKGRLTSTNTNTRGTTFTYNTQGFLESITDSEGHTTTYEYDPTGRVIGINRPDSGSLGFTYDNNGNMTVLTNPVDVNYGFEFNTVNLNSSYTTPLSGSYSYIYDKDRRLIQTNFPSGKQIFNIYDKTRISQIQTPEGNVGFTYLCGTKIDSITKGAESISYGYDGKLVTAETSSGTLNQALGYTYNNDFDVLSFTYAGQTENYSYDNDGFLTATGAFNITRNTENGLPETVSGGPLNLARTFNGYGEVEGQGFTVGGQNATSWALTRDNNGRIVSKTETVGGVTSNFEYTYDSMGRLLTVTKDGDPDPVEAYGYDLSGTRISETNTFRGFTGRTFSYSDDDHLLTAGSVTYSYDLDGFLTTKTDGTDVTTYSYSSRGELLNVTLPDGTVVEYDHDPLGRRIAKKVDGAITEKYLWQGLTWLLAIYDGSDNLLMRFEYADGRMPVAMTKGGTTYYLTYDQVGSLRVVADSSGSVVKSLTYDSFGNLIDDTNPSFAVPFGFAGGLDDVDTELVRFGYRDYDPNVGRWTAKDPIFFAGGDTDLYGYVLNDPVNLVDPLGLEFSDILPGIKKAIVEGTKGGAYAVSEASKATADMAMHGHPLAQTALGVALVSEAVPAAIIAGHTASTSTLFLTSAPAAYNMLMGPIKGNPPITVTLREAWKMIEMTKEHYFGDGEDSPCK